MKFYLVGGAVRDQLLNRPVTERDYVVVGATAEQMLAKGFTQVGKDFPVFLHPKSKEEYALARTERKSGCGYHGFECNADTSVTLEEDLRRRDLTINAMALDQQGELIDPYGGKKDLEERVMRHVSDAFAEDPLRVLRVARFMARYAHLGFSLAPETQALMGNITASGEMASLSPERVWRETARALMEPSPQTYFEVLRGCGGLDYWLPELAALWGVPNPVKWHPEVDTGVHTMMVLAQTARDDASLLVRFAALTHDLGKALTPKCDWPSHRGHELLGLDALKTLNARLKVPNDCRDLALLVCRFHGEVHRAFSLTGEAILELFDGCDLWRKPERFALVLEACQADARGRTGFENSPYPQADYLRDLAGKCMAVDSRAIVESGIKGAAIGDALRAKRVEIIRACQAHWQQLGHGA